MIRGFKRIKDKYRKRFERGKGTKLIGEKSLECNYNPDKKTYNPHFHIIVPNKEIAKILKAEWLQLWTKKHTHQVAQHIRKVKNLERDMIETIKYGSKIFTEPYRVKKGKNKIPPMIYAAALDNIFVAMKGHRLFDRFGFNHEKQIDQQKSKTQIITDIEEFSYDLYLNDWLNYDTGELLTSYTPTLNYNTL